MNAKNCCICGAQYKSHYVVSTYDQRHGYPGYFSIVRCAQCGHGRTEPSLSRDELASLYADYYPRKNITPDSVKAKVSVLSAQGWFRSWWEGAATQCYRLLPGGGRVLDVGCGDSTSMLMSKHFGADEVVGVEVDREMKRVADALGLDMHLGQVHNLPASYGRFDYILARQMIEHEPDPECFLMELKARLTSTGSIILSFPNVDSIYRRLYKERWLHWHVPFHINHFSWASFLRLTHRVGLTVVRCNTATPLSWLRYQIFFLASEPKLGQPNAEWDRAPQSTARAPFIFRVLNQGLSLAAEGFRVVAARVMDILGVGDSFVVVLKVTQGAEHRDKR